MKERNLDLSDHISVSESIKAWLLLLHAPGVGPITFRNALEQFGSPQEVLSASSAMRRSSGVFQNRALKFLDSVKETEIKDDLEWLEQENTHVLTWESTDYPELLKEIPDPPPVLFVRGDPKILSMPQVAIVGSRNSDLSGKEMTHSFARELARAGLVVTSGMALGIDTEAHQGALESGKTVAVVGTGPDRVYPAKNRVLAHQIAEQGAIVSEFPVGTQPRAEHFPRRNRIISGLALGTLVVQAARKSGSLITARMALEQGREVFAIPGSIHNPLARGCHKLIREGAKLVETAEDIIEELGGMLSLVHEQSVLTEQVAQVAVEAQPISADIADPKERKLLEILGFDPMLVDDLIDRSGLTSAEVSSMILKLEIEGWVANVAGGRVSRLR